MIELLLAIWQTGTPACASSNGKAVKSKTTIPIGRIGRLKSQGEGGLRGSLHGRDHTSWTLEWSTDPSVIRCPFPYALADTEADPLCQASLVRSLSLATQRHHPASRSQQSRSSLAIRLNLPASRTARIRLARASLHAVSLAAGVFCSRSPSTHSDIFCL